MDTNERPVPDRRVGYGFQCDLEAMLVPSNLRVVVDEVYIRRDRLVLEDQAHFHQRCEECCGLQVAAEDADTREAPR